VIFSILGPSVALAELQVFPLRVVLTEKDRATQVSLRHRGSTKMRYRISTVFYRMSYDGSMTAVEKTTGVDVSASDFLRFSPKQITLEPNIEQVVRVILRLPADLKEGEYRTHLHFEEMESPIIENAEKVSANTSQFELKAKMAVAIPVIVKKGTTSSKSKIENFKVYKLSESSSKFSLDLLNEGNGFFYGDLEIFSLTKDEKNPKSIFNANGLSSYIEKRTIGYSLPDLKPIPGTKLRVVIKSPISEGSQIIAESQTEI